MSSFLNNTDRFSSFRVLALLVVAAALVLWPATAVAGDVVTPTPVPDSTAATGEPPGTTTTTTTGDAQTTTTGSGEEGDESPATVDQTAIAIVFILLAALGIVALFLYLGSSQKRFFETIRLVFGRTGVVPEARPVSAFPGKSFVTAEGTIKVEIKGPGTFSVGEEVTFSALAAGSEISVDWEVTPADNVSPTSATGSSITFKASAQGLFRVTAKAPEGKGESAVEANAVTPADGRPSLPFVGESYGAALIAIVAVAGVVALGLAEVIKGEAIATFFGALLGYVFGKGVQSSQSGTTSDSGSDSPE
jgi:hypothetical protein